MRRADGRSLGALFRDEFAPPWDLDVHIGLTSADERRVVPLADPDRLWPAALLDGRDECYRLALDNPPALAHLDVVNSSAWRRAEVPAVNAHGTARGVAKFYAGLLGGGQLDGLRVLSAQTVAAMTSPQTAGPDPTRVPQCATGGTTSRLCGYGRGGASTAASSDASNARARS